MHRKRARSGSTAPPSFYSRWRASHFGTAPFPRVVCIHRRIQLFSSRADEPCMTRAIRHRNAAIVLAWLICAAHTSAQSSISLTDQSRPAAISNAMQPRRAASSPADVSGSNRETARPQPTSIHALSITQGSSAKGTPLHRCLAPWLALSLAGQAAILSDARTTLDLRASHPITFYESDPVARPFVNLPPPAYVASAVTLAGGISALGWKLRDSGNPWLRRHWWIPQATQILLNAGCAARNAHR